MLIGEVWAAESSSGLTSVGPDSTGSPSPLKSLSAATFTLPLELGYVQESAEVPNSGKTVIHIQDAHCNYAAQKSIAEILNYLTTEYGIYAVNCEGGAESYDLSPFTVIPEKDIREKTADFFVKEGVVSAAEYYAVNNPEKVNLWGVEDPDLYLKNLKVYRDSLAHKDEVDRYIRSIGYILDNLKRHLYSSELLELDKYYTGYKDGKIAFKEYILYLIGMARNRMIDIKSFSNMYLLSQTLADEDKINFKRANNEKDDVVDKLKKSLSRNELEELMVMVGKLKAERISQADFYAYLIKKAKSVKLDISGYPELQKYIVYISLYAAIDRTKVTKEIDALEHRIKTSLYENDTQRELGILSKNLAIMKNVFNISLTRDDYIYYEEHRETFVVANYISFIDKKAPLYKISAVLDKNIGSLDVYREKMDLFYECSLERDKAFIKNIKFTDHDRPNSIIITGGFHTENLRELFKDEKVSYISIMPKFVNEKGYESPYLKRLAGQSTALENVINTAIPAVLNLAIVNILCNELALKVKGPAKMNQFKLAVAIMAATIQGKDFVLQIDEHIPVPGMRDDEKKFVTFVRPEGADIPKISNISATEPAKVDAVLTAFGPNVFEWTPVTPKGQKQAATTVTAKPGEEKPIEPGGGLIGKLLDRNGNVITGGFIYVMSPDGKTVEISHPDMEDNITVNISGVVVPKDKIVEAIKSLAESLELNTALTKAEKDAISSVLKGIKGAVNIIAIKPMENVKGFYHNNTLFLSEDIVDHPLGLIHEMGEGSENILRDILIKADLLDVQVPGLLEMTYAQALNAHTLWRGLGKDARNAFGYAVNIFTGRKDINALANPANMISILELIMKEKDFEISDVRKARLAQNLSPLTESEIALIHYNASQGREGRELLYGLQDHLDADGNMRFTQTIKALTGDLRGNVMNLHLMSSKIDTKAGLTAIGRETAGKYHKQFGTNTHLFYFDEEKSIEECLKDMVSLAMKNPALYPKISVNCQSNEQIKAVNDFIENKQEEYRYINLRELIAIFRDFGKDEEPNRLVDEVKVVVVHSAILNDRRLSKDFNMGSKELWESRKGILQALELNGIIDSDQVVRILEKPIDKLTGDDADRINRVMDEFWRGKLILHCTKIDWKSFDDFKRAQRQLLQAV